MSLYKLILAAMITFALSGCSSKSWDWFFNDDEEELVYEEIEADEVMIEEEFVESDADMMAEIIYDLQELCADRNPDYMARDLAVLCDRVLADGGMVEEVVYDDEMEGDDQRDDEMTQDRRGPRYHDREHMRDKRMDRTHRMDEDKSMSRRDNRKGKIGAPPSRTVIHFGYKQSRVSAKDMRLLERHAGALKSDPDLIVTIEGHTDTVASASYNKKLGMQRARMIANLLEEMGANSNQIVTVSYGEERPLETGGSEAAQAANRRVELIY